MTPIAVKKDSPLVFSSVSVTEDGAFILFSETDTPILVQKGQVLRQYFTGSEWLVEIGPLP